MPFLSTGQWIFPTCLILIGQFKFPACQPYARVERNVFFQEFLKGGGGYTNPISQPHIVFQIHFPNTQNPCHSCLQEICHPTFKCLYFSSIILRAWLEASFSVFSQERYVPPLLFTVTQTYGKQTSLSTAWPRAGAVLALHVVCFLVLSVTRRRYPLGQVLIGDFESRNLYCSFSLCDK